MNNDLIVQLQDKFNNISNIIDESSAEFWYARDLQDILGYERWDKFKNVIDKAKTACENSKVEIDDHFRHVGKMVSLGSGAMREIEDIMLTRYACYLIAQNSDSSKDPVAFAQTYFAIQTRKQELLAQSHELKERLEARTKLRQSETELSQNIYERGVNDQGFARIRSKGDGALFGGTWD